jgi:ribonuclease E
LAVRAVRDYFTDEVGEIWVDDEAAAKAMRETISLIAPRKVGILSLYVNARHTMWEHFNVLRQIEQIHAREVPLPSGGRLVFDQTEALMAIDINSGKSGGKAGFEAMAFKTNMEAASAIARQLRMRDIGGQIVIDFIEMRDQNQMREVEKEMRQAMKYDMARHDIGKISTFGLMQIVRQRTGSSAISISTETCPNCGGTGVRRNLEWQAQQSLRDIHRKAREALDSGQSGLVYTVETELALYLLNNKRQRLTALEQEFGMHIEVRPGRMH